MTFGEVRFQLAKRCPGTDPDILDGLINEAYQSILDAAPWKLLQAHGWFHTIAPYSTGTVALTGGALLIEGTGTVWTADMVGMGVWIPGRNESYRFNFVDETHGALDRPYEGGDAAEAGYKLYQDVYELPDDFGRPVIATNERVHGTIEHWDDSALSRTAPARILFGEPALFSLVTPGPPLDLEADLENDRRRAQLYPIPAYAAGYPFKYLRRVPVFTEGDTDVPVLPWVSTKALMDKSRAAIEGDKKNYTGQDRYNAEADREIERMLMNDARLRGPQRLRMAPQYTRLGMLRALRGSPGAGRKLP